jgi:hypothetical protein
MNEDNVSPFFDTTYHALETAGSLLVTADKRYIKTATASGSITSLADWARGGNLA